MEFYCPPEDEGSALNYMNLLLASISAFLVSAHIAEVTMNSLMIFCTLVLAAIMVGTTLLVVVTYDDTCFTPTTDKLIRACCVLQLCSILWRLCMQKLDPVQVVCSVASTALLGLITAYSQHLEAEPRPTQCIYLKV